MLDYNWTKDFLKQYKYESNKYTINFTLTPHELVAFKSLINVYLNSNRSWEYTCNNGREHYLRIIADNILKIELINKEEFFQVLAPLSEYIELHICFDAKNINILDIISYLKNGFNETIHKIEIQNFNDFCKKVKDDICHLLTRVKEANYIDNYFFQKFELINGNFNGYYDFDYIKLDFGAPIETRSVNRVIRCKIKYKKIICSNIPFNIPVIETIKSDAKTAIALCQLFLRCAISPNIYNGKYHTYLDSKLTPTSLDDRNHGIYIPVQRGIIDTQYIDGVPSDTPDLFRKFKSLDYEKQNVFIVSCHSYAYANKLSQVQAVTHYVIALENLAEFEYMKNYKKASHTKIYIKDKIFNLIKKFFNKSKVSKDFVDYFYSVRCLYAHEGVANNRIYQDILGVHDGDNMLQLYMEELTYSVLTQWLIEN